MPEVNLKDQINVLVQLQKIDSEIYVLKSEKEAKPQELEILDKAFAEKKQHLADLEKNILDLQKQKKDHELELGSKEEAIKKSQGQLYQLKTNKEYQAMIKEIDGIKADASLIEDKVLEAMDQTDNLKREIGVEKKHLLEEEEALNQGKKKIEERIKEIDGRLSQLEANRKQVMPQVNDKILASYERVLVNRDGLAIVAVKNEACGGCNMHVPPQVVNLIKMYENIVTCEMCNRILYLEDETA